MPNRIFGLWPLPENPLIKPPMDEHLRTAYCREGTEKTAINMNGIGRPHLSTIITSFRRRAQESATRGSRALVPPSCCASHIVVFCISYPPYSNLISMSGASPHLSDADDKESHTSSPGLARCIQRSSSFPAWAKKITSKIFLNTKSDEERKDLNQKGKAKQSVTVNEILASGEVRQEPGLPAKD